MSEEPDDGERRESSDSSASGSGDPADEDADEQNGSPPRDDSTDEESGDTSVDDDSTDPQTDDDSSESTPDDDSTENTPDDDSSENPPDDEVDESDDGSDDESDAPEFTNVEGLGNDNDASDADTGADDSDGDETDSESDGDEGVDDSDGDAADESGDDADDGANDRAPDEYMFEDYDPDEPPEDAEGRGAQPPARSGGDEPSSTGRGTPEDEGLLGGGPDSDQEMPLAAHIEEMMKRLSVVFIVGGVVALTLLGLGQLSPRVPTAVDIIDVLWNNAIPGAPEIEGRRPRVYSPLELILTELKVTALAGLLVALPVFVYETYLFMRPGLFPKERRYYISAIPTSLILGTIGMAFSHFIVIPAIMRYFTLYTDENVATVAYGLESTFSLILVLMGYMAVIFQIPLFIMLAIMMGLVTREWLEDKRLLFWGGFLTISFLVNPDPTGMTPFIIAATMIVLYEGTLALLRWTGN